MGTYQNTLIMVGHDLAPEVRVLCGASSVSVPEARVSIDAGDRATVTVHSLSAQPLEALAAAFLQAAGELRAMQVAKRGEPVAEAAPGCSCPMGSCTCSEADLAEAVG